MPAEQFLLTQLSPWQHAELAGMKRTLGSRIQATIDRGLPHANPQNLKVLEHVNAFMKEIHKRDGAALKPQAAETPRGWAQVDPPSNTQGWLPRRRLFPITPSSPDANTLTDRWAGMRINTDTVAPAMGNLNDSTQSPTTYVAFRPMVESAQPSESCRIRVFGGGELNGFELKSHKMRRGRRGIQRGVRGPQTDRGGTGRSRGRRMGNPPNQIKFKVGKGWEYDDLIARRGRRGGCAPCPSRRFYGFRATGSRRVPSRFSTAFVPVKNGRRRVDGSRLQKTRHTRSYAMYKPFARRVSCTGPVETTAVPVDGTAHSPTAFRIPVEVTSRFAQVNSPAL
ncbi:hypothetical protein DFH09DRAFT_1288040 [Mycena vulgaris]|nr:hypothetical protein DFH09DRAFT_1288040 [Mycena vulgaris]